MKFFWQNQAGDSYMCSYTIKSGGGVTFRDSEGRKEWLVMSCLHYLHASIIHISIDSPINIWSRPGYSDFHTFSLFVKNAHNSWPATYNHNALIPLLSVYNCMLASSADFPYSFLLILLLRFVTKTKDLRIIVSKKEFCRENCIEGL